MTYTSSFLGCTEDGASGLSWVRRFEPGSIRAARFAGPDRVWVVLRAFLEATASDDVGSPVLSIGNHLLTYVLE